MLILQLIESGEQIDHSDVTDVTVAYLLSWRWPPHNSIYRIGKWIEISFVTC